ncbi:SYVM protein, partial [Hydrobates tethys]|nr:SYVM protein [Oceanodroma tethys]
DGVSPVPAGAVKVTPGHSPPDLVLARAHGLPLLSVIGDDGTMCPPGGGWLQVLSFPLSFPSSRPQIVSPGTSLCPLPSPCPLSPAASPCPHHPRVPGSVPCHFSVSPLSP